MSTRKKKSKIKKGRKTTTFTAVNLYKAVSEASDGQWTKDEVKEMFVSAVNQLKIAIHTHDNVTIIPDLLYLKRDFYNKSVVQQEDGTVEIIGDDYFQLNPFIPILAQKNFRKISRRILPTDYPYEDVEVMYSRDSYLTSMQNRMLERERIAIVKFLEKRGEDIPEELKTPFLETPHPTEFKYHLKNQTKTPKE